MISRRAAGRQVVVKQPVHGLFPPVRVGAGIGQLPGVLARQVIHPPPTRRTRRGLDEAGPGKLAEHLPRFADRSPGQGSGSGGGHVRARIHR